MGSGGALPERRGRVAAWTSDLALGIRLAVGGGRISRTGAVRLLLSTVGIGLAVAVLLVAAAAGPAIDSHRQRTSGMSAVHEERPGVDPVYVYPAFTSYRGENLRVSHVYAAGPSAPVPPGLDRLPGQGELVLSPALAGLLASPEGELLRPRFAGRVIGTIGVPGLASPHDLRAFVGVGPEVAELAQPAYGFGSSHPGREMPSGLLLMLWVGVVVLLVPVFIFVATATRIAGSERDRRLAALRLVGSDARQVRRIAAAESLVGAVAGVVVGIALFLLLRSSVSSFELLGEGFFPADLTPSPVLAALALLAAPVLAVLTAQFALRNTAIEPLGVVRQSRPGRRRVHWRVALTVLGVGMLFAAGSRGGEVANTFFVAGGAALLLTGVSALLPWLLEWVITRVKGSVRPSLLLAVRRLQLDSGTPARVVSGVAVVLAGAIAFQALIVGEAERYKTTVLPAAADAPASLTLSTDRESVDAVLPVVRAVPGVTKAYISRQFTVKAGEGNPFGLGVTDCDNLRRVLILTGCQDGQVFLVNSRMADERAQRGLRPGTVLTFGDYGRAADTAGTGTWRLPESLPVADVQPGGEREYSTIMATPGALRGMALPEAAGHGQVWLDAGRPDLVEHVRNALAPFGWRVNVWPSVSEDLTGGQRTYVTIRNGLLAGSLFTLVLAGMSMLVLALEQMRERRRTVAVLSATGVPTGTLARSVLWQTAIPVLFAVGLAVAAGILLAALVLRLSDTPFTIDWTGVGLMSTTAIVLVLLVTALTLPSLRGATRLTALRTE